jgi:integron integrase
MTTQEALERFDKAMREMRFARSTRCSYRSHVACFGRFKPDEPCATPEEKVSAYLSWLALNRSESHQRQGLNALVCFYKAMGRPLAKLPPWVRPKPRNRVPNWVTMTEARAIINHLREPWNEVASMLVGSGLRIGECLDLRVKDLDLHRGTVTIRSGKGDKDRVTLLARSLIPVLERRLTCCRAIWQEDRAAGRPGVFTPDTITRKYPRAGQEWAWFWLWPAPGESTDPDSGIVRRHHRHEEGFSKALKTAVRHAGIGKRVTAHAFRHGFATAYLENGGTVQELQHLMGHSNIETTEVYLHCLPRLASRVSSPLDVGIDDAPIPFRKIS